MAEDELIVEGIGHVGDVEGALLVADFGIEEDVEEHVAQLLADFVVVFVHERLAELEGLLDGV